MRDIKTTLACLILLCAAHGLRAEGVPAGTLIENTATVTFELDGTPTTVTSNTTALTVAELIDVAVSLLGSQRLVSADTEDQAILFRVVNTGNGSEGFSLAVNSAIGGDDFDPIPSTISIYFDTDGSGDLTAADEAYVPGVNDPVLAADASIDVLLLNNIPAGEANGAIGRSELVVVSLTGTDLPGTNFAGQGDGGVDAIIGTSEGSGTAVGEYLVSDVQISVVKNQAVLDQFGGSEPLPGATITYTISVQVSGSGIATGSVVSDEIPEFTSYVANSIQLDGSPLSDAVDADAGELNTAGSPVVVVRLGDVTSVDGVRIVEFQVLID